MHISWNKILYVYAFLLFLMNFIRIFDNAFWGDEGFSIRLAQMTVGDMAATAADVHPPLYYLFVQLLYPCVRQQRRNISFVCLIAVCGHYDDRMHYCQKAFWSHSVSGFDYDGFPDEKCGET